MSLPKVPIDFLLVGFMTDSKIRVSFRFPYPCPVTKIFGHFEPVQRLFFIILRDMDILIDHFHTLLTTIRM